MKAIAGSIIQILENGLWAAIKVILFDFCHQKFWSYFCAIDLFDCSNKWY